MAAKCSHRLTLFYLANDVIQHAKRKGFPQFVQHFAETIKKATILCKDDKISSSIDRVFNIWLERNIYSEEFIEELRELLSGKSVHLAAVSKIVAEFKLSELIEKIRRSKKAEQMSCSKNDTLLNCKVDATSGEVLNKLKDKTEGEQFSRDFDDATKCLEAVIASLEKEVIIRTDLIAILEKSEVFYETQKEEAKTVVDAYKNFGLRVKNVWRKLEESRSSLPSPLPSPPRDAPSPTNSDDGPNLPAIDMFGPEVNALLRQVVSDNSKGVNQTPSSLDQRLSTLMHGMPQMSENPKSGSNDKTSLQSNSMQTHSNNSIISETNHSNNWIQNPMNESNISVGYGNDPMFSRHMNLNHNQLMYDYNYSHPMQDMNQQNGSEVQHIQALVSSRGEQMIGPMPSMPVPPIMPSSVVPPFGDYSSVVQSSENFEQTDMDLGGNSDDEDINTNRSITHRTIKVIDTRRNSNDIPLNDFNNVSNDRIFNNNNNVNSISSAPNNRTQYMPFPVSSPQLKSVARMPIRSMNNVQQSHPYSHSSQWRTPRSAVMSGQHMPPSMNAPPPQHNRNQHNWRSHNNRNNRKSRY